MVQLKTAKDYRKRATKLRAMAKAYPPELHNVLLGIVTTYESVADSVEGNECIGAAIGWSCLSSDSAPLQSELPTGSTIYRTRNTLVGFVDEGGGVFDLMGDARGIVLADGTVSDMARNARGVVWSDGSVFDSERNLIGAIRADGAITELRRGQMGRVEPQTNIRHAGAGLLLLLQ